MENLKFRKLRIWNLGAYSILLYVDRTVSSLEVCTFSKPTWSLGKIYQDFLYVFERNITLNS